jgi:predicted PurR-regulated permease PerM
MSKTLKYLLFIFSGVFLLVFIAWYFSSIFLYVIIALVLSTVLRPLTNYIHNIYIFSFRIPRLFAVGVAFTVLALVVWLFSFIFIPFIGEQIQIFSKINFEQLFAVINEPANRLEKFLITNRWTKESQGFLMAAIEDGVYGLFKDVDFTAIVNNLISFTGSFSIGVLAVVFITFFLLYENGLLKRSIIRIIPNRYFEVSISGLYKAERLLSNYLIGLLFQMTSIFTLAFLGLSFVGIKYAATIALFAAVINIIPYMGPVLGVVFAIFVGLSTATGLESSREYMVLVFKISMAFGFVKLVDDLVLQPLIFSKSVKAHPLEIFIIIFAGATVAGIPGMIAAIPVYTIIRVSGIELSRGFKSYRIFKI